MIYMILFVIYHEKINDVLLINTLVTKGCGGFVTGCEEDGSSAAVLVSTCLSGTKSV